MAPRSIDDMVEDLTPVKRVSVAAYTVRIGVAFALAAGFVWFAVRPRPDLAMAMGTETFWYKQALLALPVAIGAVLTWRLARPGALSTLPVSAAITGVFSIAALTLMVIELGGERPMAELRGAGANGLHCLVFGTLAALPMLAIGLQWLRGMAPTRLPAASIALGALAAGVGMSAYALHCPYESAGYILVWYGLAMALVVIAARTIVVRFLAW